MSTATYDRPLYAVPAPPATKARFAYLLALRRRAAQALDAVLALPRSAAGWALRHLRTLLGAASDHRLLGWAGARISDTAQLVRGIGPVPVAASLLSTPPIWRATVRLSQATGSALASLARSLWTRTKALLGRAGTPGASVSRALSTVGIRVKQATRTLAAHPATLPITTAVGSLAGLVRPVSHSLVAHRLAGLLVPTVWLRVALELIALPLLLAPALPGQIRDSLRLTTPSAPASRPASTPAPMPAAPATAPAPTNRAGASGPAAMPEPTTTASGNSAPASFPAETEPLNRAERRAQQQEQARAKRASARH